MCSCHVLLLPGSCYEPAAPKEDSDPRQASVDVNDRLRLIAHRKRNLVVNCVELPLESQDPFRFRSCYKWAHESTGSRTRLLRNGAVDLRLIGGVRSTEALRNVMFGFHMYIAVCRISQAGSCAEAL